MLIFVQMVVLHEVKANFHVKLFAFQVLEPLGKQNASDNAAGDSEG